MGKYQEGFNRPILVWLIREAKRNEIFYANKNLPSGSPLLWINDDVSYKTRGRRKTICDIATLAKINGNDQVRVHSNGLVYGDDKFRLNDLDLLPPDISVEKAKLCTNDTDIYFQSENSPFSNFFVTKFAYHRKHTGSIWRGSCSANHVKVIERWLERWHRHQRWWWRGSSLCF